jgi:DNA-binding IclR family transcriptional regulator
MAFMVVQMLAENKELSPSQIARAVGRSVSRVSHVLAALRLAEVVR